MQQLGRVEKVRLATEPKGSAAGPESPTPTSPTTCSARCWSGPSACRPGASADGAPESYPTDRETGRLLSARRRGGAWEWPSRPRAAVPL